MRTQQNPQTEPLSTCPRALSAKLRLITLQKLHAHLELDSLFKMFTQELEKQIDITRLIWEDKDISHIVKRGDASIYRQTFHLTYTNASLGTLQYTTPYQLDVEEINLIHSYHQLLAGPLFNAIEYRRVKDLSFLDGLTKLNNRSRFEQDLQHVISINERKNNGLILMIFDIDHFKAINDRFGHLHGDQVLCQFSTLLNEAIRTSDRCYRLGGDEFAVILSLASQRSAQCLNQRLKQLILNDPLLHSNKITSSAGCAFYRQGETPQTLFERADKGMYRNKNARRG